MTQLDPRNEKSFYSPSFYTEKYKERISNAQWVNTNEQDVTSLMEYYKDKPVQWINDWATTYNPRNSGTDLPTIMPFILFPKQEKFIEWLYDCVFVNKRRGVVDKCRDSGATWLGCAFSVWMLLHHSDVAIGWGSRKYELVEKKGAPDCIFEKMRQILNNLPMCLRPNISDKNGLISNRENGSTISGEGGDNIGRGGRTTVYFVDEHAFLEHAESISASLSQNTDVEIDISTHNGTNTLYFTLTQAYDTDSVFVFDWWENPFHDEAWFKRQEEQNKLQGTPWIFEQEVMRNPGGSVPGILIPSKYVRSAIDAHIKLGIEASGERLIALDVANEGADMNCAVERHGILVKSCEVWHEGTTTETTNRVIQECDLRGVYKLVYEAVGVGAGVKGEAKRQTSERLRNEKQPIECIGWEPSGEIIDKREDFAPGKNNADMFQNCNGQAAWDLRERFRKTYECIELGMKHDPDQLISLDSNIPDLQKLVNELSQPKLRDLSLTNGKIAVDKKPKGTKSPNRFDAAKIAFARLQNTVVYGGSYY